MHLGSRGHVGDIKDPSHEKMPGIKSLTSWWNTSYKMEIVTFPNMMKAINSSANGQKINVTNIDGITTRDWDSQESVGIE